MIGWQPARMVGLALLGAAAVSFSPNWAEAQVPCSYSVTILPDVDCGVWQAPGNAVAMNNNGVVVGHFISCGGSQNDSFYWNGGATLTVIPKPQWMQSFVAADINDEGLIVGTANTNWAGQRAYIYNIATGQWTEIPPQNPNLNGWSAATGINNSGQVCGWRSIDDGGDPTTPQTAFIYDVATGQVSDLGLYNGESTGASAINELGNVGGAARVNGIPQPMLWIRNETFLLPMPIGAESFLRSINNSHLAVGAYGLPIKEPPYQSAEAFLWNGEVVVEMGALPGDTRSAATDINDSGLVVGVSRYAVQGEPQVDRGFLWYDGTMHDLTIFIEDEDVEGVSFAGRILNDGRVLGSIKLIGRLPSVVAILTPASPLIGDVNADCTVDVADLIAVIGAWGSSNSPADANHDSIVNVLDLLIVIGNWT